MKSTTRLLTMTTVILATIIVTMITSSADANKRNALEFGDIAFVDVFKLIDRALLADEMAQIRTNFNTQSDQALTELNTQLQTLQTTLSTMQQTDPKAAETYQQYQTTRAQLESASQQFSAAYQVLIAGQLSTAYAEIYAAANEIGQQEGFSFVFATRSDGELIQTDTITGITQEILARPLMTPPNSTDLTELVRVKLGYPEKAPDPVVEEGVDPASAPADEPSTEPVAEPAAEPVAKPEATPASEEE